MIAALSAGCAATYQMPEAVAPITDADVAAPQSVVFGAARRVLVSEGFQILSADEASGTISSVAQNLRVFPGQADCGTTMSIDYLKDPRTTTRVAYGVIVHGGRVTVKSSIEGEYKPGSASQNITLSCVSRGQLENQLLQKILASLK
jgi:hypothetical protein